MEKEKRDRQSISVITEGKTYILTLKVGALAIAGKTLDKVAQYRGISFKEDGHGGGEDGGTNHGNEGGINTVPKLLIPFSPMHEIPVASLFFVEGNVGNVDASKVTLTEEGSTENLITNAIALTPEEADVGTALQLQIKAKAGNPLVSVIAEGKKYILTLKAGALTIGGKTLNIDAVYRGTGSAQSGGGDETGGDKEEPSKTPALEAPFAPMHETPVAMVFFADGNVDKVDATKITLTEKGSNDNLLVSASAKPTGEDGKGKVALLLTLKTVRTDKDGNALSSIAEGKKYILTLKAGALTIGGKLLAADAQYEGTGSPQTQQ